MKSIIREILKNVIGIEVSRVDNTNPKEYPDRMSVGNLRRLVFFYDLFSQIKDIDGDIVECGVGWGCTLFYFSLIADLCPKKRQIYAYGLFEGGYPERDEVDKRGACNVNYGGWSITEDQVKNYLIHGNISHDFINDNITFVKGPFSETLVKYSGTGIAFLYIDANLYKSCKDCLNILYPKIVKGGIIAFSDYERTQKFPGARKAIDKFLDKSNETIIKSSIVDLYYLVKSI